MKRGGWEFMSLSRIQGEVGKQQKARPKRHGELFRDPKPFDSR
jgi:hypothetical protein